MTTRIAEVGRDTYQISTYMPDIDFAVNQYLVTADEPLLFHTGMRGLFPETRDAIASVIDPTTLRWISFGHVEADECGAMNEFLMLAPGATVLFGQLGCMLTLGDIADREPRAVADGEVVEIGNHRVRWIDTPHLPHGWEAGLLYDETTRTLFCGDLFSTMGAFDATTTDDIVAPAIAAEDGMPSMSLHPRSGQLIRALADLDVDKLALMHGPVFTGDCEGALLALADDADRRVAAAVPTAAIA